MARIKSEDLVEDMIAKQVKVKIKSIKDKDAYRQELAKIESPKKVVRELMILMKCFLFGYQTFF